MNGLHWDYGLLVALSCKDSGVDKLVLGMAVLQDIFLLDAEALLGRKYESWVSCGLRRSRRGATPGMVLLVKTNYGWIDVRFRTDRLRRSCEVIGSNPIRVCRGWGNTSSILFYSL
ncbi:hypothetical protein Bca4012_025595 [Brassica carinata]|uniref:Uncharacterized protein n=1 Tax=Brassica carinata TaxID=52824 RepID=A0A8X8ARP1_BRACI|nr:hypothetical protein Bca52824_022696 [Brassica carinata]